MTDDFLTTLQSRRDAIVARISAFERELAEIHAAMAAVENLRSVAAPLPTRAFQMPDAQPKRRRGEVMKAVLDAIREGSGNVQEIRQACAARGLDVSSNSVSNTISRLQKKRSVLWSKDLDRWVAIAANRDELMRDLRDSLNAEGSKADASEPSALNGATSSYTRAASEGPTAV